MSETTAQIINGTLTAPAFPLPAWAQDRLHLALWDRDIDPEPETIIVQTPVQGEHGSFRLALDAGAQQALALTGHRAGAQHIASITWGAGLDLTLAHIGWPKAWVDAAQVQLDWDGRVTLVGYVEQLHYAETGGLLLAVLEFAGYAVPISYRRFPPLPVDPTSDRHSYHTDRRLDDRPEQLFYLLADAEAPLAGIAHDALVTALRTTAFASLAPQAGGWHEIVPVPLLLDGLTVFAP